MIHRFSPNYYFFIFYLFLSKKKKKKGLLLLYIQKFFQVCGIAHTDLAAFDH